MTGSGAGFDQRNSGNKCREEMVSMAVLGTVSLKKWTEVSGKNPSFSVECRLGSQVTRSQKFRCGDRGFEDPDARLMALRFGFLTEGLVAFRSFLFEGSKKRGLVYICVRRNRACGLRFADVVIRVESGVTRSISFKGSGSSDGDDDAVERAFSFVTGSGIGNWVRWFMGQQVESPSLQQGGGVCGHCGQRKQQQQQQEESDDPQCEQQISEDYKCFSCKKIERDEITIIRMDEQGEYKAVPVEDISADNKSVGLSGSESVCSVCGCEDNEKFETMIHPPCNCNGSSFLAHPSCVFASLAIFRRGNNQAPASCKVCGGRGTMIIGSAEEGSSKPTGVNPNFRRNTTNATQKKGVKRVSSDLTNGGVEKADLSEIQPLQIFNEESGRKAVQDPQKDDFSISESEKLGITIPTRRFDDAVASVPIKKRKYTLFQLPSPPPASPTPASPLRSSSPELAASLVRSEGLPSAKQEQGEQQVLEGMAFTGESLHEKYTEVVGQPLNENTLKIPSSVGYFPQDIGVANLSGNSRFPMSASIGKPGSNSLEDRVSKVELMEFKTPKPTPEILNDGDIGSQDNKQEVYSCMDTMKQEEDFRRRDHVLQSDLLLTAENEIHVIEGISDCNNLSRTDNITCMETEESMELGLCCNSVALGSRTHLETTGCSKMSSVAGECSAAGLQEDGEKQEKGILLRLDSGYFNDDRSHWDLNTPMDSWEKQLEVVNTDSKSEFLPADTANYKNSEHLDGIQVHILASEAKHDTGKSEQDMLSKVLQADQDNNALNFSESSASGKDSELDTSLRLRPDAIHNQCKMNLAHMYRSVSLSEESVAERELNLSIAPSGGACESVIKVSGVDAQDDRHFVEKPSDCLLATDQCLQSDSQLDNTPIDDNVDMFDKTESSADCKQDKEPAKDNFEATDGTSYEGNSSGPETTNENPDLVQINFPSSPSRDQRLIETVNEDSIVDDANAATICAVNACVEDINTTRENPRSPELGLDKQSTEDATEIAYGGDSEFDGYDDEYELVSDTDNISDTGKEIVEQAENEHQAEEGEYRETGLHTWVKEDTGEELEDEHVDYGDSDGRDADDLGMDLDDRGKDVEHEKNWDDDQQSEMEEKYDTDSHHEEHDSQFDGVVQVSQAGEEDTKCESVEAELDIQHATEKQEHKGDGDVSQTTEVLGEDISLEVELKCHQDQNKGVAAKSREGRLFTPRQKSSGWDQLPDGFESAAEALKAVHGAVHGTFNKRGRGAALVSGGRIGPMSSRGASSRRDGVFGERMDVDDSMHRKEGFFIRGRDGSLPTSPSFASRKPTRGRIVGRGGGPSRGMHNMGRAEPWADGGTRHLGPHRHHSPDYYGDHVGFGPHVSANAAAMSAAKVESSGFVVSMDGTVTKVVRGGIRGRRGRGALMGRGAPMGIEESRDFGLQMSMGPGGLMSDTGMNVSRARAIGIGPDRISAGNHVGRERYREPSFGNNRWDHSIGDSPHRMDHQLRERNRSFTPPPGRRLTRMLRSHTQSRSRSGTRSPRPKSSPRGSTGAGIGRGPAPRRRSRTPPTLRSESRMDRPKSPLFQSVGSFEHRMFLPSSRTRRSPPQSSKWSYDRRDTNHFKDSEYKRSFRGGSPSKRMSPRVVHESGLMSSPGRLKHSEYRGTVYTSRTAEFGGDSRRFKHDESEDVRLKQSDNSGRSIDVGSTDIRRYRRQDDEGDCQARNSRAKDAGISREQGRGDHNSRL